MSFSTLHYGAGTNGLQVFKASPVGLLACSPSQILITVISDCSGVAPKF